jgi:transposase InsO family protein
LKIKCLRSDNGGVFTSYEFNKFCEDHGIRRHSSVAITPQQNGVVERKNRNVQEIATKMLNEARLSVDFWREVVYTTVYILRENHS